MSSGAPAPIPSIGLILGASAYSLSLAYGPYALTGVAAALSAPAGSGDAAPLPSIGLLFAVGGYSLTAAYGAYSLTGEGVTLTASNALLAAFGSYSEAGQAVTFSGISSATLLASAGAYDLVGAYASSDFSLPGATGAYTIAGENAALGVVYTMQASGGSYILTGEAVVLTEALNFSLAATYGAYSLAAEQAIIGSTFGISFGAYGVRGTPIYFFNPGLGLVSTLVEEAVNAGQFPWVSWQADSTVSAGYAVSQATGNFWNGSYTNGSEIVGSTGPPTGAPATIGVPDLVGLTIADARATLAAANLGTGGFAWAASSEAGGTILSQSPAAGTEVEPGSSVTLTLSLGVMQ